MALSLNFVCLLLWDHLSQVFSEIQFGNNPSSQTWYPAFYFYGISGSCSETVTNTSLYRNADGVWYPHNQVHDYNADDPTWYAYDYTKDFSLPIDLRITKSNGDIITFENIITTFDEGVVFSTGVDWCDSPTSSPTEPSPTISPSKTPTKEPSSAPSELPTGNPTISPSDEPTVSPTTYPPTVAPTSIPSNTPTAKPITMMPTSVIIVRTTEGKEEQNDGAQSTDTIADDSQNINTLDPHSDDATFFGVDHSLLIATLGVTIGILVCCIILLFVCWWNNRKRTLAEKNKDSMEVARIITESAHNQHNHIVAMDGIPDGSLDVTSPVSINSVQSMSPVSTRMDDTLWLKMWLNSIGLLEYLDLFMEHGFGDHIATIATLTEDDLLGMRIQNENHRKVILNQVDILKINGINGVNHENGHHHVDGPVNPPANPYFGDGNGRGMPSEIESVAQFPATRGMSPALSSEAHTAEGPDTPNDLELGGVESQSFINLMESASTAGSMGASTANFISD